MKSLRYPLVLSLFLCLLALTHCGDEDYDYSPSGNGQYLFSECLPWTGSAGSPFWLWKVDSTKPCQLTVTTFDGGRTSGSLPLPTDRLIGLGAKYMTLTTSGAGVGYGVFTIQITGPQTVYKQSVSLAVPSNAPDQSWKLSTDKLPLVTDMALSVLTKADVQKNMTNEIFSVTVIATAQ